MGQTTNTGDKGFILKGESVAEKSEDSKVDFTEQKEHKVDLLLKLKFHEENLLAQRLAVFLVTSSILFLSFA